MSIKLSNSISLWARRLALYSGLGAVVTIVLHIGFFYMGFMHTDVDSARYMLSALIQGEFAVVALVITLSVIAVQLAASSYSARVIDIFRRTPDLWILIGVYGVSIFYGLGVVKLIEKANPQMNTLSNLEAHISFSYFLGVFAFATLLPYIWNTFNLLKPSTVINILSKRITKQSIISAIEEPKKIIENDPMQPIIDIVLSSLMKYDRETVREGLRAIGDRINYIFENEILNDEEEEKVSLHVFSHFSRIGKLAVSREDEDSALEVINNLGKNEDIAAQLELRSAALCAAKSLEAIGLTAAERKLEHATKRVAVSLGWVGITMAENKRGELTQSVADRLEMVGKKAAEHKLEEATLEAIFSLRGIGKGAARHKLEGATKRVAEALEKILIIAKQQNLIEASEQAEEALKKINENRVHNSYKNPETFGNQ